ncbi:nitrogen assimilation transcription factor nirA [Cladorrhinum sp. PSN259]|nr:nitrogen assimilation transcription factor nirA [Cladorrhinum sp. PSN259]
MDESAGTWTNVTSDIQLVRHLLDLYFCWEYPTLASLSKEHFYKDFEEGRQRYCSSLLINALLALGSRFCNRLEVRGNPDDPYTAGDRFFQEAQRLFWELEEYNELTVIQALGIMAIREASCGRDFESRYYAGQSVRLAIETGLHRADSYHVDNDEFSKVRLQTFWGAFALDNAWSITTGALPHFSRMPRLPPKIRPIPEVENALWTPYTDDGLALEHSCEQPCHIITVYNCFCELSQIVHSSLYRIHCVARKATSQDILGIYAKYISWYDNLPETLRLGSNFTPQVLFTHLYYHFAIVLTFRPFIEFRIRGSEIVPRELCLQAANTIQTHLKAYSRLYSLRRTPSFVPYVVLVSSRVYVSLTTAGSATIPRSPPSRVNEHIKDALRCNIATLDDMAACHRAALIGANMLRYMSTALKIYIGIRDHNPQLQQVSASTAGGPDLFASSSSSFSGMATSGAALGESAVLDDEEPLQRALSWPAPRQTPSMVPHESKLEEAGFESW